MSTLRSTLAVSEWLNESHSGSHGNHCYHIVCFLWYTCSYALAAKANIFAGLCVFCEAYAEVEEIVENKVECFVWCRFSGQRNSVVLNIEQNIT